MKKKNEVIKCHHTRSHVTPFSKFMLTMKSCTRSKFSHRFQFRRIYSFLSSPNFFSLHNNNKRCVFLSIFCRRFLGLPLPFISHCIRLIMCAPCLLNQKFYFSFLYIAKQVTLFQTVKGEREVIFLFLFFFKERETPKTA